MVLPTETRGANLLIDLDAIAANYRLLQREAAGAEVAAVVKADAYGLGMAEVAPVLSDAGCQTFFTATPEEGLALRDLLPDAGHLTLSILHSLIIFSSHLPRFGATFRHDTFYYMDCFSLHNGAQDHLMK